ncbi:MAG: hypothetical protein J7518_10515 [Nocardioidaceae bacterium]|nr:hypothetical protein [Nocardioidaceae bacterium]
MTDPLDELRRWVAFGGTTQVESETPDGVVVGLCRCDGGERVGQVVLTPAEAEEWLS